MKLEKAKKLEEKEKAQDSMYRYLAYFDRDHPNLVRNLSLIGIAGLICAVITPLFALQILESGIEWLKTLFIILIMGGVIVFFITFVMIMIVWICAWRYGKISKNE